MTSATHKTSQRSLALSDLKFFFNLAGPSQWNLSQDEQLTLLGLSSRTTLHTWRKKLKQCESVRLSRDTLDRLSLLKAINHSLNARTEEHFDRCIRQPCHAFGGETILNRMLEGSISHLLEVQSHISSGGSDAI